MKSGEELAEALDASYPELVDIAAVAPDPVYLVGGAVRDLLLGRGRADIDLVVEGDPAALAAALGAEVVESHSRFGTLKVVFAEEELDLATARRERYPRPGALPEVELGAPIRVDLARRDFTVNAMAVPLGDTRLLIDPYDGQVDLEAGVLRAIHAGSFLDDPTRAIRAARYAARFGLALEPETRDWLLATDLGTITPDRRWSELRKLAAEESATRALELLAGWGLVDPRPGGESFVLARDVNRLMAAPPWSEEADRAEAILAAALGPAPAYEDLVDMNPSLPSEGVRAARGRDPIELVLARAAGATWLDDSLAWREVTLDITGADLIAAGLSGPAIGHALQAALTAKLDAKAPTRADELRIALAAAASNP